MIKLEGTEQSSVMAGTAVKEGTEHSRRKALHGSLRQKASLMAGRRAGD